jgi:protein involved in polysaccharide export with SLBB domain
MKSFVHALVRACPLAAVLSMALLLTACGTLNSADEAGAGTENRYASAGESLPASGSTDILRPGDFVSISFTGLSEPMSKHEERIKEDGTITLTYIGSIQAAGKTRTQLEQLIESKYVPKFFNRLTVRVAPEGRFFYVYGEVNNPNRHAYQGEMTVLRAIAASGDFTNFANKKNVQVTRTDGRKHTVNCIRAQRNTSLDLPVYPEDVILVKRRVF